MSAISARFAAAPRVPLRVLVVALLVLVATRAAAVLAEAREAFSNTVAPRDFDLIEIPFPERGEPELIPEGARQRPEPQAEPVPPTA